MVNYLHSVMDFKRMTPAQKIAISFLFVIFVGTILLMLPISNKNQEFYAPIDALFTATSATCVTGLVVDVTIEQFSLFGQIVVMGLIQVGGLGLMTLMALFILLLKSRLSMHEKLAMKEMLNRDRMVEMHSFLIDILKYTILFESVGMFLLACRFVPEYGLFDGLFKAMFISISAFCNAGFDILGSVSLMDYAHDPVVIFTVMMLIILGGLGFAVWFDVRDKIRLLCKQQLRLSKVWKSLNLHTRIVLTTTCILIFATALLLLLVEFQNQKTIGSFSFGGKIMTSLFESVTLRTAGFASVNYADLMQGSKFLMILIMFIGGSPGGTAGGIKTTTLAILVLYIVTMLKGHTRITVMHRTIEKDTVVKAMGIFFVNLMTLLCGVFLLCIFEDHSFIELLFEATSAMATVGLSLGITSSLTFVGKVIIILLMFIGRIGITTFVLSLLSQIGHRKEHEVNFPVGNVIIG